MAAAESASEAGIPADAAPVRHLALRDGALALAALSLWAAADTWWVSSRLGLAWLVSVLDGAAVGAGLGLLAHEWGHFVGARRNGGIAPTRGLGSFFPIFQFDMQRNGPGPFRAMGVGGNAAHWSWVLLLGLLLPLDTPGRQALFCGALGFAAGASLTEFPVLWRAWSGVSNVESFRGISGEKLRRNRNAGIALGLALFVLL